MADRRGDQGEEGGAPNDGLPRATWSNGRFHNPWSTWKDKKIGEMLKLMWHFAWNMPSAKKAEMDRDLPVETPNHDLLANPPADAVVATWIGHATVLVQMDGYNIVTDPVWSQRASAVQFAGPKRIRDVPMSIEALPRVDVVVVSHDHYDHCDVNSLRAMHAAHPEAHVVVPLRLKAFVVKQAAMPPAQVHELDWWDTWTLDDAAGARGRPPLRVRCLPAQHWSNRGVHPHTTLWGGFSVRTDTCSAYFAGDTGYCEGFRDIGREERSFDLALIPIGAYSPRWFMCTQHITPEEAVQVHQDIHARKSLGIHWGTFILTDEPLMEPRELLRAAVATAGLDKDDFVTINIGASLVVPCAK